MRIPILWTIPPDRAGRCLRALLPLFLLATPSIGYSGSISAYRDPSGRVIFVNEPGDQGSSISASDTQARITEVPVATPAATTTPAASNPIPALVAPSSDAAPSPEIRKILKIASTAAPAQQSAPGEPRWDDMAKIIEWTASRHEIDPDLVRAIVRVESNFNPRAVSRSGARGLMQLIPATARRFGVDNIFDPKSNLDGGVRYLKHLMSVYGGNLKLSLAAYNAGENAVDRHNGVPPYPETQDYLRKIAQTYPLNSTGQSKKKEPAIEKYLDESGVVHFTNAE